MALIRTAGKIISEISKNQQQVRPLSRCLSEDRTSSFESSRVCPAPKNATPQEKKTLAARRRRSKSWIAEYFSHGNDLASRQVRPKDHPPSWLDYLVDKVTGNDVQRRNDPESQSVQSTEFKHSDAKEACVEGAEKMSFSAASFPYEDGEESCDPAEPRVYFSSPPVDRQPRPRPQPKPPKAVPVIAQDHLLQEPFQPCARPAANCTEVMAFSNRIPCKEMRPIATPAMSIFTPIEFASRSFDTAHKGRLASQMRSNERFSRIDDLKGAEKAVHNADFTAMSSTHYLERKFDSEKWRMVREASPSYPMTPRGESEHCLNSSVPTRLVAARSYSNRSFPRAGRSVEPKSQLADKEFASKTTTAAVKKALVLVKKPTGVVKKSSAGISPALVKEEAVLDQEDKSVGFLDKGTSIRNYFDRSNKALGEAISKLEAETAKRTARSRANIMEVYNVLGKGVLGLGAASETSRPEPSDTNVSPRIIRREPIYRNTVDDDAAMLSRVTKKRTERDDGFRRYQMQSPKTPVMAGLPMSSLGMGLTKESKKSSDELERQPESKVESSLSAKLSFLLGIQAEKKIESKKLQIPSLVQKTKKKERQPSKVPQNLGAQLEKKTENKPSKFPQNLGTLLTNETESLRSTNSQELAQVDTEYDTLQSSFSEQLRAQFGKKSDTLRTKVAQKPEAQPEKDIESKFFKLSKILWVQPEKNLENTASRLSKLLGLIPEKTNEVTPPEKLTAKQRRQLAKNTENKWTSPLEALVEKKAAKRPKQPQNRVAKKIFMPTKLPFKAIEFHENIEPTTVQAITEETPTFGINDKTATHSSEAAKPHAKKSAAKSSKNKKHQNTATTQANAADFNKPKDSLNINSFRLLKTILLGNGIANLPKPEESVTKLVFPPKTKPELFSKNESSAVEPESIELKRATTFQPKMYAKMPDLKNERLANAVGTRHPNKEAARPSKVVTRPNKFVAKGRPIAASADPEVSEPQKFMTKQIHQKNLQANYAGNVNSFISAPEGRVVLIDGKLLVYCGQNVARHFSNLAEGNPPPSPGRRTARRSQRSATPNR